MQIFRQLCSETLPNVQTPDVQDVYIPEEFATSNPEKQGDTDKAQKQVAGCPNTLPNACSISRIDYRTAKQIECVLMSLKSLPKRDLSS